MAPMAGDATRFPDQDGLIAVIIITVTPAVVPRSAVMPPGMAHVVVHSVAHHVVRSPPVVAIIRFISPIRSAVIPVILVVVSPVRSPVVLVVHPAVAHVAVLVIRHVAAHPVMIPAPAVVIVPHHVAAAHAATVAPPVVLIASVVAATAGLVIASVLAAVLVARVSPAISYELDHVPARLTCLA